METIHNPHMPAITALLSERAIGDIQVPSRDLTLSLPRCAGAALAARVAHFAANIYEVDAFGDREVSLLREAATALERCARGDFLDEASTAELHQRILTVQRDREEASSREQSYSAKPPLFGAAYAAEAVACAIDILVSRAALYEASCLVARAVSELDSASVSNKQVAELLQGFLAADMAIVAQAAARQGWTDETAVPSNIFLSSVPQIPGAGNLLHARLPGL